MPLRLHRGQKSEKRKNFGVRTCFKESKMNFFLNFFNGVTPKVACAYQWQCEVEKYLKKTLILAFEVIVIPLVHLLHYFSFFSSLWKINIA